MSSLAEPFIPCALIVERHEVRVAAPASVAFEAALDLDLWSIPSIRGIFWLREKLLRSTRAPRPRGGVVAETLALGWGRLEERPGRSLVMGAVTKPWEADVHFRAVPADHFAAFAEPDLVKIVWTLEAEPIDAASCRFATETRVAATNEWARRRFIRYWRLVGIGIVLIRWLALPAVKREAERRFRIGRGESEPGAMGAGVIAGAGSVRRTAATAAKSSAR
jgi:hypothetical protein